MTTLTGWLGPHGGYVAASYLVAGLMLGGLALASALGYRSARARLAAAGETETAQTNGTGGPR